MHGASQHSDAFTRPHTHSVAFMTPLSSSSCLDANPSRLARRLCTQYAHLPGVRAWSGTRAAAACRAHTSVCVLRRPGPFVTQRHAAHASAEVRSRHLNLARASAGTFARRAGTRPGPPRRACGQGHQERPAERPACPRARGRNQWSQARRGCRSRSPCRCAAL
jgi:hypothetical protein